MIDLSPLISFLRIVSLIGLIITIVMMVSVTYNRLDYLYPGKFEKHKWLFGLFAIFMSGLMVFLFQRFVLEY